MTDPSTDPPTSEVVPAKIVLDKDALEIQDLVVITFLLVEKGRRWIDDAVFRDNNITGRMWPR